MDDRELLKYAVENGMINMSYVQEQIEMNKRKELLEKHPYSIWKGKDGKWHTYLPDSIKGRVPKRRSTKENIEKLIIEYWKDKEEKPKTFDDAYHLWRKNHDLSLSNNSISRYNTDYIRFFENSDFSKKSISSITEEDVQSFMIRAVKDKSLCKKACKTLFGYIKNTFRSAQINHLIEISPVKFLEAKQFYKFCTERIRPKEKTIISDESMSQLFQCIISDYSNQPEYIPTYAVHMAVLTGMRVGELSALRWDAITDEYIMIDKSEKYDRFNKKYYIDKTKNGKDRIFPITEAIRELLDMIRKIEIHEGYICEWVFANENGRIHAPMISSCSKNKCRQAGLPEVGIHAFRRTFNSKMRCAGVSKVIASSIMGHSEEVNEEHYTFDITDIKKKAIIVTQCNKKMIP